MKRTAQRLLPLLLVVILLLHLPVPARAASVEDLKRDLRFSFETNQEVDVQKYNLDKDTLHTLFTTFKNNGDLPWYADNYRYYHKDALVTRVEPLSLDPSVYDYDLYEKTMRRILSRTVMDGMSQWQIALSIHDYLITHCAYDETLTLHEGYDALIKGTAVCSGYARAYRDLLNLAGIPCRYISGNPNDPPGHGWNLVNIRGNWYHVDATWDDPTPNVEGRVRHEYFLLTDQEMLEREHYGWETDVSCTDTTFQNSYWRDIDSPICPETGSQSYSMYFDDYTYTVCARDDTTGDLTSLNFFDKYYIDIGPGQYGYTHYGLSLHRGRLYYANMDTVYSMNTDGSDKQVLFAYDTAANGRFIEGFFVDDGIISLTLADHDRNRITQRYSLGLPEDHVHKYFATVVPPTCQEQGYTLYECECGDSYKDNFTDRINHNYERIAEVEPTYEEEGYLRFRCTVCGDTFDNPIPRLEPLETTVHVHHYTETVVPPTCQREGYTLYECECGDSYRDNIVPATEHRYHVVDSKQPTKTEDGYKKLQCTFCGATTTQVVPYGAEAPTSYDGLILGILIGGGAMLLLFLLFLFIIWLRHR